MSKSTQTLPAPLARAAGRFEKWRRTRTRRAIPPSLWDLAATMAGKYGVNKTAKSLRLDYYDLKRRAQAEPSEASKAETPPRFVEVAPVDVFPRSACLVELENPRGVKMRIHLKAAGAPELAALRHLFWKEEA